MATQNTEFHDILVQKGIIPSKEVEVTEEQIVCAIESIAEKKLASYSDKDYSGKSLQELDDLSGDDEDERMILEYRRKRIEEIRQQIREAKFGDVREISAENYIAEVNKAGPNIWVLVLLYQTSSPLCEMLQEYWQRLSVKFPAVKFLKSLAEQCIPNFPAKNLPAVFVYFEDTLKKQFVGSQEFTKHDSKKFLSIEELEWKLHEIGAVKSTLTENPALRRLNITANGILLGDRRANRNSDDCSSDDDW